MKNFKSVITKEHLVIVFGLIVISWLILAASSSGAMDRSFSAKDTVTGNVHQITERSRAECVGKPHYSTVKIDGVERRCIKE